MIYDLFHTSASSRPEKLAVVGQSTRLTYDRLRYEAGRLSQELRRLGARNGDRVAVWMTNSAEAAVAIWAVFEAGCVLVPLRAASHLRTLRPLLASAEPRWLIVGSELATPSAGLLGSHSAIEKVLVWRPTAERTQAADARSVRWTLAPTGDSTSQSRTTPHAEPSILAALIYTSGSTGEPKGVMLSHANMQSALKSVNAYLQIEPDDVIYSALPLSSSYGLYQLLIGLAVGATVVLDRSFAFPARSLSLAATEQATVFAGVPTMFAWMASSPLLGQFDLSHLRILTSAAASLPVEHARRIRERLPQARLFVMYGQTECKRISYLDPADLERKPGSVGRGMPYQEHAVVDESGRRVPAGEIGELVVSGQHVMQGYWRNEAETKVKLRPIADGARDWLHTGDLFRIDEEGYLYFIGRKDDILKIGGNKVSPREIEDVLCQMPEVLEAAVVGIPDDVLGEAAKAYVVLRDGVACDAESVIRFCRARLRGFMVPIAVVFARALPKTELGKMRKADLS